MRKKQEPISPEEDKWLGNTPGRRILTISLFIILTVECIVVAMPFL